MPLKRNVDARKDASGTTIEAGRASNQESKVLSFINYLIITYSVIQEDI